MAGILDEMGLEWSADPNQADVLLYNTCTIRDNAEQKVYSYLGRQAKRKHEQPGLTLVVAGCVAQQEGGSFAATGAGARFSHGAAARQSATKLIGTGV